MQFLIGLMLATLVLVAINIQRAYGSVSVKELKRRARADDELAKLLHRAVAYGHSLRVVLWFVVGVTSAWFFWYVARHTSTLMSFVLSAFLIWIGFVRVNDKRVHQANLWLAAKIAPLLAAVLGYIHPVIDFVVRFFREHRPIFIHTGLYDKEDLLELISNQNVQADNRIEQHELELAFNALTFGDKQVGRYLTPRRMVKSIPVDESIGPVLMSELHDSGFSRFPVYEGRKDNIVGTLFLRDLVKTKSTAKVSNVMRREVSYIHEDQSLHDALQAILKTHNHLMVVVNSFEEYVGVISMEDVLEQIVGKSIQDEFDQYEDLRAVAARAAKQEHKEHQEAEAPIITPEVAEPAEPPKPEESKKS